jgi:hypothetical protein
MMVIPQLPKECFWCRREILNDGVDYKEGAVTYYFHRSLLRDCMNEYLKWKKSSPSPNSRFIRKG